MDESDIHRNSYEMWRDLLIDSMKLAGIEDEATKFTVFKVKAGMRLLEIFKSTCSDANAPDPESYPFSNALYRLKSYFGSGSDIMMQRRKLSLLTQKSGESHLTFINRVGATARLCDFNEDKEFEGIVGTVAEHAIHKDVRAVALKLLSRKGTFTDLVDKVREIEAISLNEEFFKRKHVKTEEAVLARVANFPTETNKQQTFRAQPFDRNGFNHRFRPYRTGQVNDSKGQFRRSFHDRGAYNRNNQRANRCWRCNSVYHLCQDCPSAEKVCHQCGRTGHIKRACNTSALRTSNILANRDTSSIEPESKSIAVVENTDKSLDKENVSVKSDEC
ncbi:uncharacterized protein LOC129734100 [Wyeomyia smithii]|uniref:uncharacterized protein LOC129734100 n=1 Tax=Wyeomyia smithii TaxID=174621 RepID=UPI002467AE57|nr:uncharacterized protein LOC129734100 [Wyeomyia smithii]